MITFFWAIGMICLSASVFRNRFDWLGGLLAGLGIAFAVASASAAHQVDDSPEPKAPEWRTEETLEVPQ